MVIRDVPGNYMANVTRMSDSAAHDSFKWAGLNHFILIVCKGYMACLGQLEKPGTRRVLVYEECRQPGIRGGVNEFYAR